MLRPMVLMLMITCFSIGNAHGDTLNKPADKTLKTAVFDGCPFTCPDGAGRFLTILNWALEGSGYEMQFMHLNFERAKRDLARGKIDLLPGILKDGVSSALYPDQWLFFTQMCFVTRQFDPWHYSDLESLSGRSLILEQGILYEEGFLEKVAQLENSHFLHGQDIANRQLQMLVQNRGDTAIIERTILQHHAEKMKRMGLEIRLAGCFKRDFEYVAISAQRRDSQQLKSLLNRCLIEVHKSDRFRKLIAIGASEE